MSSFGVHCAVNLLKSKVATGHLKNHEAKGEKHKNQGRAAVAGGYMKILHCNNENLRCWQAQHLFELAFDNLSKNMARICVCRLQLTEAEVADPESDEFSFSLLCLATKRFTPMKRDWLESQIVENLVTAT